MNLGKTNVAGNANVGKANVGKAKAWNATVRKTAYGPSRQNFFASKIF